MFGPILYLTESDVQQTLTVAEAVCLAERGIKADAAGKVAGNKFYMDVGENGFIKPFSGYMLDEELAFVKTFSFFPGNPERFDCGTTSSMVLLFSAEAGLPVCLMDGGWVTALKTGASTAVTAAYLARADAATVTIFGAGTLGRMHLRALACCFDLRHAYIVDILPEAAAAYVTELQPEFDFPIESVPLDERERAVRAADVVFTVTTGNLPVVEWAWLRPGAFVARLGSYQEVTLDVITEADKVVVDNWHYVSPRIPELKMLAADGRFGFEDVYAEWPDIVGNASRAASHPTRSLCTSPWASGASTPPFCPRCTGGREKWVWGTRCPDSLLGQSPNCGPAGAKNLRSIRR